MDALSRGLEESANRLRRVWLEEVRLTSADFCFFGAAALFYTLPIVAANVPYAEDYGRHIDGHGWDHDGRVLATWMMRILSFDGAVGALNPYSTIASAFLLATSVFPVALGLLQGARTVARVAALAVMTTPFALEVLWFRYDSLPMAASFACVVVPFVLRNKPRWFAVASTAGVLACGLLYQPTASVFSLLLVAFTIQKVVDDHDGRDILALWVAACIGVTAAAGLYFFVAWSLPLRLGGRETPVPMNGAGLHAIVANVASGWRHIACLFDARYVAASAGLVGLTVVAALGYLTSGVTILRKVAMLAVLATVPVLVCGPNLFLAKPNFGHRTLLGYAIVVLIFASLTIRARHVPTAIRQGLVVGTLLPLMLYSLNYAASVGNVMQSQTLLAREVIRAAVDAGGGSARFDRYLVNGSLPLTPESQFAVKRFPIIGRGGMWRGVMLKKGNFYNSRFLPYFGLNGSFEPGADEPIDPCQYATLLSNGLVRIGGRNKTMLLDFEHTTCP